MTGQTIILRGPSQRQLARDLIDKAPDDARVTITEAQESRTAAQNRMIHKWFAEIARHYGDRTADEVKAECNLTYGLPIKSRDEEWAAVFGYLFKSLNYAQKLKAIRILDVPFTRKMTVAELSEYMEQMSRDYRSEGVFLTDPELRGWE